MAKQTPKSAPMIALRFTKQALAKLEPPKVGRRYVHDTESRSLIYCLTATGAGSFYLVCRMGGRPRRLRLGAYPDLSVEQARKAAAVARADIVTGGNPQADRCAIRCESTFGDIFDAFMDLHAKPHKRTWYTDEKLYNRHLKRWGPRRLSDITRADVANLHAKIGKTAPYQANRMLALVSVVFNFATTRGAKADNPVRGIRRFRETSRDRFLSSLEMKRFLEALADEPSDLVRDFFMLSLLTGGRRSNVESMAWSDLNLDRGVWRIPGEQSKNGEPMLVVLPDSAVAILRRRLERRVDDCAFVFPTCSATGHLVEPKKAWRRILARAGIADLRPHDLRRTLASWQAITGTPLPIIGKTLGHKSPSTTAIYARLDLDPVRVSVERATRSMMLTADGDGGHIDEQV